MCPTRSFSFPLRSLAIAFGCMLVAAMLVPLPLDAARAGAVTPARTATRQPAFTPTPWSGPVMAVYPRANATGVALEAALSITFDRAVDRRSAEAALSIRPAVAGTFAWEGDGSYTLMFTPDDQWPADTTITATLASGIRAAEGALLDRLPYAWRFTTAESNRRLGWGYGPNAQVLDADGVRRLEFTSYNCERVRVRLYAVTPEQFVNLYKSSFGGLDYWDESGRDIDVRGLPMVREFTVRTQQNDGYYDYNFSGRFNVPADVGPGLYIVKLSVFNAESVEMFLVVSRNALVLKEVQGQLVAWVASIQGGQPAAAQVTAYGADARVLAAGPADEQGVFRANLPADAEPLLILADAGGGDITASGLSADWKFTRWSWWWRAEEPAAERWAVATYTDRPIYRPGQTVYVKSILRRDEDAQLGVPSGQAVTLRLRDSRDYVVAEQALTASAYGTLDVAFPIADGVALGDWNVELVVDGEAHRQPLKVEEYRKPEIEVRVTTDRGQYARGDAVTVAVEALTLFGQPAAGLPVTLRALGYDAYYYDWETDTFQHQWVEVGVPARSGKTDAQGRWVVQVPDAPFRERSSYDDWYYDWEDNEAQVVAFEATVEDESQPISGHAVVIVHRAAYGLNVRPQSHDLKPGVAASVDVLARDVDGKPFAGAAITLTVYGYNRQTYDMDVVVTRVTTVTDADGAATAQITVTQQGWYELRAAARDAGQRDVTADTWLWVYDWDGRAGFWSGRSGELSVSADRDQYAPGDTAQLLVQSPVTGTALLTLERGTTRDVYLVELSGATTLVPVQIKPEYAPNIFATISIYQPQADHDGYSRSSWRPANLLSASAELRVPADSRRLHVDVTADQDAVAPGQAVDLTVQVTGADGAPAQAEVSVAVVDEAIFLLSPDLSTDLYDAFYYARSNVVQTYDSLQPVRWLPCDCGGGGGGGPDSGAAGSLRRNFPDTAFWQPAVVTDADGRAVVHVTLPDSLTRWRIVVKAVTAEGQISVGEATTFVTVTQPIVVRPQLPRTLVQGDAFDLRAVAGNYAGRPVSVTVWAELDGLQHAGQTITQTLSLDTGSTAIVTWPVTAAVRGTATVRVYAVSDAGRDAVELTVPVAPLAVARVDSQSGQVADAVELVALMPTGVLTDVSTLEISLSPSIASEMLEGLEYLTGYPYGCVEQTMSRALPNAAVSRAFRLAGLDADAFSRELPRQINAGLQRLYGFQHDDGGWGWWWDDDSDEYQTAYVLFGLSVTRAAGYQVDGTAIERGAEWLGSRLDAVDAHTRAYALYALSVAGQGDLKATQAAAARAENTNLFGRAALALALDELGDRAGAQSLIDGLIALAVDDGGAVYWRSGQADGHYHEKYMASDLRTTALVLDALARLRPDSSLVPQAVLWLMAHRTPQGWGTTQETSYAIIALSDYLLISGELGNDTNYSLEVNGAVIESGALTRGDGLSRSHRLVIPATRLQDGSNRVRITRSGPGALYYAVTTRAYLAAPAQRPAGTVKVVREILDEQGRAVQGPIAPGTVLTVRVRVTLPKEGWYVLVEDHLPGGFEALNERLATSSYDGAREGSSRGSWQSLGYNRKDVRDDRVDFFVTYLPAGQKVFAYRVRAVRTGVFQALPAEVSLMYASDVWGRSASRIVVVSNGSQPAVPDANQGPVLPVRNLREGE